ncbi:glycosyltransferase involved in cell wall biosynthesis [Paenibacillus castaneae]|uniref:glycosyltransferase family 4 protein n=1 Tax=Paenibacillus castaneae TaxID=474957 RepID=UPI000C9D1C86|nr:glycosyltransferase family 4 protein [Paenibacillus castaneae]NIK79535.1 glycosyltransferase involved in cell wall biosynthesis [Paenibacillus castaneae]
MKVWMWPKSSELNFYNDLLSDSLNGAGMDIVDLKHGKLLLGVGRTKPGDIVHIHWMHHAYQNRNPLLFIVKSFLFIMTMLYLKLRNVQLVWTIHNLYPHQVKYPKLERFMRTLICKFCSKLIVASESIKRKVMSEFNVPEGKLFVVKHGHYLGVYKPSGIDFRQRYRISADAHAYLFLGAIKAYKGVEDLIEAFNAVKTPNDYLIIAGKADQAMESYLKRVEDTENIILDMRFIPNEEVADLISAVDVMVMPYKEITTSGSAILGLSFKKLIVMPDNDFINEYFTEDMVVRYDPHHDNGLENALKAALHVKRQQAAPNYDEVLKDLDWSAIALKIKKVYQGWG